MEVNRERARAHYIEYWKRVRRKVRDDQVTPGKRACDARPHARPTPRQIPVDSADYAMDCDSMRRQGIEQTTIIAIQATARRH
jgi:hypothetical protein